MPLTLHTDKYPKDFFDPKSAFFPGTAVPLLVKIAPPTPYKVLGPALQASLDYWSKPAKEREGAEEPEPPKGKEEALAIETFAWFLEVLEKGKFRYIYDNTMPILFLEKSEGVLFHFQTSKRLELNCKGVCGSLLQLFRFLGYAPDALKWQMSNPASDSKFKIVQRQSGKLSGSNVRSVDGPKGDASYPFLVNPPAQKDIDRTNGIHVRRSAPPDDKKPLGTIVVEKSNRDPFENHFVAMLDLSAVKLKFFDVLTGCRYKNGQDDFFEPYTRSQLKADGKTYTWYQSDDEPERRIYEVQDHLAPITGDATFKALEKRWAQDGKSDITFWWIVDPEDFEDPYFDEVEDDKKNPDEHPPLVCHIYGVSPPFSVADMKSQWDRAKSAFEKATGKKKPSETFLGIRTGSGIDSAMDDLHKVFYKRDASYDKAFEKVKKSAADFKKLCDEAKKKAPPKDPDSKLYVDELDTLQETLALIIDELAANRPSKG